MAHSPKTLFSLASALLMITSGALPLVAAAAESLHSKAPVSPPLVRPDRPAPPPKEMTRSQSASGKFALTFPTLDWIMIENDRDEENRTYDLSLKHRNGSSFVRAHIGRRDNRGIEGSLIRESAQAKYLIEYDPQSVDPEISTEDYQASAVFCGRRRQGPARRACSRVKVALHGREVVKLYSLIDADTPRARKTRAAEVSAIFESLELLPPLQVDSKVLP